MFLNGRDDFSTPILIDQDVDYYGFLASQEFKNLQDYIMQYMPMDVYVSPYFGQGSGAYRELDKVYEAYRQRFVGLDDIRQPVTVIGDLKRTVASAGISPALILAAAAAFFFAG